MRRAFWFAAGAGVSVYAMNRVNRLREAATVEGLKDRLGALALGARMLRDEVAQGQAEKETELRERLGLAPHGIPEIEAGNPAEQQGRHRREVGESVTAPATSIDNTVEKEGTD